MSNAPQDLQAEVKKYIVIFGGLIFLLVCALAIKSMHLHLALSVFFILVIAAVQATLSACYFMHLMTERRLIFMVVIFCLGNLLFMVALLLASHYSVPEGLRYVS